MFLFILSLIVSGCTKSKSEKKQVQKPSLLFSVKQHQVNPESILKHKGFIYVSNQGQKNTKKDGYISKLDTKGNFVSEKWTKNLDDPKGLAIYKGNLYVTDITKVYAFNIESGSMIKKIDITGAQFLNDITIAGNGTIYISDTLQRVIYIVDAKTNKSDIFISKITEKGSNKTEAPNGLFIKGTKLYVASWSKGSKTGWEYDAVGSFFYIDIKDKSVHFIAKELGRLDGVEECAEGKWLLSAKKENKVFRIDEKGKVETILDNTVDVADIGYDKNTNMLFLPLMASGELQAYRLKS